MITPEYIVELFDKYNITPKQQVYLESDCGCAVGILSVEANKGDVELSIKHLQTIFADIGNHFLLSSAFIFGIDEGFEEFGNMIGKESIKRLAHEYSKSYFLPFDRNQYVLGFIIGATTFQKLLDLGKINLAEE